MREGYAWFSAEVGSWFGAWGMQSALFAWLLVGVVRAPAEWVGVAQTSNMLPSLGLILIGGAFADRHDPRRTLLGLHAVATLPVLVLLVAVAADRLSLAGLIAFGLCQGCATAFAMPARDTLLSRVAGDDMMRAVTGMTIAQFGSQSLGTLLVGAGRWLGTATMLGIEALVLALGALALRKVGTGGSPAPGVGRASAWSEVWEGLRLVARTPNLRVPIALALAVGSLFVGPFLVLFPLLVRDVYQGSQLELSIVLSLFPLGTIVGSGFILLRGGIGRKGLAALNALTVGALALAAVGTGLPYGLMVVATFVWGLAGAVFINCSRTLYQEAAPPAHRGRVLAVYQLAFMGAAPLGALASGFLAGSLGVLSALPMFGGAMGVVIALAWGFSGAPRMR